MPKITVHGGPSIAGVTATWGDEEEPSASNSSETSSEKPQPSQPTSETAPSKPARTMGSRSKKGRMEGSSAPSTGGGPAGGTSATGSEQD
ncbi:hypothetical protein [Streptomyces sp. NRRL F-5123]|uniref:hypothetical protein n=1 Tax=Streptomyces sp. NRRL F-5123 TaxID=1463856 RepID=UPI000AFF9B38|nr:hypothetical protein [Streptomyces sp. NRRL F-5123]